ncbi:MAG: nuclear transport factor 2 family protein [Pseudomonas sp.]|uniref:nuclear transport factor 2 family protein n=1 Tax=Pseudomonas sp. TaxID=306 RepID=UPI003981A0FA
MSDNPQLQTEAAATLAQWHSLMQKNDLSALPELLHPQAVFRSPMAYKPYAGAPMVSLILNTVSKVFVDFAYHRELISADGLNVVLEFSAKVNERELKGIDMIRFDESGKIVEFEVMIRPMSGLQALGEEMGQRLAPFLAAAKR